MGDIADYINDQMMDAHPDWCPVGPVRYNHPEIKHCRTCKIDMKLKNGKYGKFWACPNWPNCRENHENNN